MHLISNIRAACRTGHRQRLAAGRRRAALPPERGRAGKGKSIAASVRGKPNRTGSRHFRKKKVSGSPRRSHKIRSCRLTGSLWLKKVRLNPVSHRTQIVGRAIDLDVHVAVSNRFRLKVEPLKTD